MRDANRMRGQAEAAIEHDSQKLLEAYHLDLCLAHEVQFQILAELRLREKYGDREAIPQAEVLQVLREIAEKGDPTRKVAVTPHLDEVPDFLIGPVATPSELAVVLSRFDKALHDEETLYKILKASGIFFGAAVKIAMRDQLDNGRMDARERLEAKRVLWKVLRGNYEIAHRIHDRFVAYLARGEESEKDYTLSEVFEILAKLQEQEAQERRKQREELDESR